MQVLVEMSDLKIQCARGPGYHTGRHPPGSYRRTRIRFHGTPTARQTNMLVERFFEGAGVVYFFIILGLV